MKLQWQHLSKTSLKGTVVYDDLANQLATPYTLDAEAMEKLIQKLKMLVSAWSMKMETQVNIA